MTRWKTQRLLMTCAIAFMLLCASGCGISLNRREVVYLKPGDPVRLAQKVKRVKVWAYDSKSQPFLTTVDLDEGKYVLDDTK